MPMQASENKLTIRFHAGGWLKLWVPVGVLAAISLIFNRSAWRQAALWEYAVIGGLPVAIIGLWLLSRRSNYLRLNPAGLTIHYAVRRRFFPWRGCSRSGEGGTQAEHPGGASEAQLQPERLVE